MARKSKNNNYRIKKKKGEYSKFIVSTVIFLNIIFTVAVFIIVESEPSTLIGAWFSFTTVELWQLARIKNKKIEKEIHEIKNEYSDNRMEEG